MGSRRLGELLDALDIQAAAITIDATDCQHIIAGGAQNFAILRRIAFHLSKGDTKTKLGIATNA